MTRRRMGGRELYARLYGSAHGHKTTLKAGVEGNALQFRALSYVADQQTDGVLPREWVNALGTPFKRGAKRLVQVGWLVELEDGDYLIKGYLDHNPSAADIEGRRAGERARKSGGVPPGKPPEETRKSGGVPGGRLATVDSVNTSSVGSSTTTSEFEEWLTDHQAVTGHEPHRRPTRAFATVVESFNARRQEGWTLDDLKRATRAAQDDDYRRAKGYTTAESVLRPKKVGELVQRGRKLADIHDDDSPDQFLAKLRGAA